VSQTQEHASIDTSENRRFPAWFYGVNMLGLMVGLGFLVSFGIVSLYIRQDLPYDYAQLMIGAERFCYQTDSFIYDERWLYPAPFYTSFCIPQHHLPQILFWLWMIVPFLLVIWIGGQRSAIVVYPPLVLHLVLGQSTWVLLPLYMLAERLSRDDSQRVPLWYGIILGLAVLKPHIAFAAWVWIVWRWRERWLLLLTGAISSLVILLPSFFMRPNWLFEWLANGRDYRPISMANIALIPVELFQLGLDQAAYISSGSGQLIIWGTGLMTAAALYFLIHRRRGKLELYDWVLIFCFSNPLMHDYDLIILLPFLGNRPQRLLLAVTAGIFVWIYAQMTGNYNVSLIITGVLILARVMRLDTQFDQTAPMIRW